MYVQLLRLAKLHCHCARSLRRGKELELSVPGRFRQGIIVERVRTKIAHQGPKNVSRASVSTMPYTNKLSVIPGGDRPRSCNARLMCGFSWLACTHHVLSSARLGVAILIASELAVDLMGGYRDRYLRLRTSTDPDLVISVRESLVPAGGEKLSARAVMWASAGCGGDAQSVRSTCSLDRVVCLSKLADQS